MIVVDTTVLVYAKGADHPLRDPCRAVVEATMQGRLPATTTAEVIQEFVHVRARRRSREDAVTMGNDFAELLSPLLAVSRQDLRRGLELFRAQDRLGAFDAVLAACAMAAGAQALVSGDRAFASVGGVDHVFPDGAGLASLLSG